jgi:predicted unusual protein kinase regulating ubiquinone biosynthesis (AarF/ABC1/UbiB family)
MRLMARNAPQPAPTQRQRYHRVIAFAAGVLCQTVWWDVIFAFPLLDRIRPPALKRWQTIARRYCDIATDMGGVLIKLGQFLSTRVDLFPPQITKALASLQDEAVAAPFEEIAIVVEAAFKAPLANIFVIFAPEPMGAASLAQAHQARLPSGEDVIVKVLRPHIHEIVEIDLKALRRIVGWLKYFRQIRQRMDLDMLLEEFIHTTRAELDLQQEKENLKRFADDFRDITHVYVPAIYEDYSTPSVLTLENVAYIKVGDTDAMAAAGIATPQVAEMLYDAYMRQIFVTNFIHVDPHPGNLFIRPLPAGDESVQACDLPQPGDPVPYCENRPFQLVFIDFGMTAVISERLKTAMRTAAIGLGTQDAHKVIQAYVVAGALQPGVDLRRLEEIHQDWLRRIWGLRLGKIQETAFREMRYFWQEYRDIITEAPFQIQADMLLIGRAVGILVGLATHLDPNFDPWTKTLPYARRFAKEELTGEWEGIWDELFMMGRHLWRIPGQLDQVLTRARQGALTIQVSLSPETRRAIRRIDLSVKRFAWMVLTVGLLVSGVNLHIAGKNPPFGILLMILAVVFFLWGMVKK